MMIYATDREDSKWSGERRGEERWERTGSEGGGKRKGAVRRKRGNSGQKRAEVYRNEDPAKKENAP